MAQRYRQSGSIGWIVPARCQETAVEEALQVRPDGVAWCYASLAMDEIADRDMSEALQAVDRVVEELLERRVSLIVYSGLPLTASRGPLAHREFARRLRERFGAKIPITTDTELVVDGLKRLGAQRISVISPYQPKVVQRVAEVFQAEGFEVIDAVGCGWNLAQFITEPDSDTVFDLAASSFATHPNIDAFYVACPQWPVVGNITRIEDATGVPVVSQLLAISAWASQLLGAAIQSGPATGSLLLKEIAA